MLRLASPIDLRARNPPLSQIAPGDIPVLNPHTEHRPAGFVLRRLSYAKRRPKLITEADSPQWSGREREADARCRSCVGSLRIQPDTRGADLPLLRKGQCSIQRARGGALGVGHSLFVHTGGIMEGRHWSHICSFTDGIDLLPTSPYVPYWQADKGFFFARRATKLLPLGSLDAITAANCSRCPSPSWCLSRLGRLRAACGSLIQRSALPVA